MEETIRFDTLVVEPVYTEREVNFSVHNGADYLFRLIPGNQGFEISALDRALAADFDTVIVQTIGDKIDRYFS